MCKICSHHNIAEYCKLMLVLNTNQSINPKSEWSEIRVRVNNVKFHKRLKDIQIFYFGRMEEPISGI